MDVTLGPSPVKSASKKVAAKSFILQGGAVATFFRSCLGGAQSIAYRNVAFRPVAAANGPSYRELAILHFDIRIRGLD